MPGDLHAPHVDARSVFPADALHRSARYDGFLRWLWVAATLVTLAALGAVRTPRPEDRARLGARASGDRHHGRRGHDARGLGRRAAVRRARALVGTPLWARAERLRRVGVRAVAGAPRSGSGVDDRAHRSAAARGALRPALVARRSAAVRRRRCVARVCAAVAGDARHSAAARHARRRPHPSAGQGRGGRRHAGPDRGRARPDDGRERDGDRDRPLGTRLHLGHVPGRPLLEPRDRGGRGARVRPHRPPPHLEGPRLVGCC